MSDYTCEHGKMAMGRYCEKCQAERDAEKQRVQAMVPRDLAGDVHSALSSYEGESAPIEPANFIAAELTRLGWVHSSQAPDPLKLNGCDHDWQPIDSGTAYCAKCALTHRAPSQATRPDVIDCILPSQATGGGLSGEARETIELALEHAHDTAAGEDERAAVSAARVELSALPVRGDGRGVGT